MSGYKVSGTQSTPFVEFPKYVYHATLPAVVVENREAQNALGEEWHDAPAGNVVAGAPTTISPDFVEFPKWKYHIDGTDVVVDTAEDEQDLGAGWYNSRQAAKEATHRPNAAIIEAVQLGENVDLTQLTYAELRELCRESGIEVKSGWRASRLIEAIQEHQIANTAESA